MLSVLCLLPAFALEGSLEYDDYPTDYSLTDFVKMEREADKYMLQFDEIKDEDERGKYIEAALERYYQLTNYDMSKVKYPLQLARIYDYKKKDRLAKSYFFRAINLSAHDAYTNYYFGDFYFVREDYKRALVRYLDAHRNGLQNKYELNYKMAVIYEKFGDLVSARKYYSACLAAMPENTALKQKIASLDELHYDKSDYYDIIRK